MSQPGNLRSPFQEGFAALREEPLLLAAELTWRWCFALAAWILALAAAALFLDSLKLSSGDRFLLSTLQPTLASTALTHILHGTLLRYRMDEVHRPRRIDVAVVLRGCRWDAPPRCAIWSHCLAATIARKRRAGSFVPCSRFIYCAHVWTWTALGCFVASIFLGFRDAAAAASGAGRVLLRFRHRAVDWSSEWC